MDSRIVGALLLIFGTVGGQLRCNLSSWYVDPAHRGHAALLGAMASKLKHVTYLNTSAAPHTWAILEAQGYQRYSDGQFAALPALTLGGPAPARPLRDCPEHRALPEYALLRAHADAGCLAVICETADGPLPFVFLGRRLTRFGVPAMQLIYVRDTQDFARCAGPLGRLLLRRFAPLVICDADAPLPGVVGAYFKHRGAKFFKGPTAPRPNDLAFTEMVVFGP